MVVQLLANTTPLPCNPSKWGKSVCYVLDRHGKEASQELPVREISLLADQTVVASLQGFMPGKPYSIEWQGYDGAGKKLLVSNRVVTFTPGESSWSNTFDFAPDRRIHKPGKWTWTAKVSGLGRFSTELNVLAPSPDELEANAFYEKARENAFRVFSHYWIGENALSI